MLRREALVSQRVRPELVEAARTTVVVQLGVSIELQPGGNSGDAAAFHPRSVSAALW